MTLHNLDSQISWLLLNRQIPTPVSYRSPAQNSAIAVECIIEEDANTVHVHEALPQQVGLSNPVATFINVVHEFARPPIPSKGTQEEAPPAIHGSLTEESMAKLSSTSSVPKPTLFGQYQPLTPTSTTGSSLSATYTASFSKQGQSHHTVLSSMKGKTALEQSTSKTSTHCRPTSVAFSKDGQDQTPARRPKNLTPKLKGVESVDLTGDERFSADRLDPGSSDTLGAFPQTLWNADTASKPRPLFKQGKKRKSDELANDSYFSLDETQRRADHDSQVKLVAPAEGFVDIDSLNIPDEPPPPHSTQINSLSPNRKDEDVHPSSKTSEEEYRVTETIHRTETRIVKSLSRKPSIGESKCVLQHALLPSFRSSEKVTGCVGNSPGRIAPEVHQKGHSPSQNLSNLPFRSATPTFQGSQGSWADHRDRVIEDSEDDEHLGATSPRQIPHTQYQDNAKSPSPSRPRSKEVTETLTQFVSGAACDDISSRYIEGESNLQVETVDIHGKTMLQPKGSPQSKHVSPTKLEIKVPCSLQNTMNQSIALPRLHPEDEKMVMRYLQDSSFLIGLEAFLDEKLVLNQTVFQGHLDAAIRVPQEVRAERRALREKKESLTCLAPLREKHSTLTTQKNDLTCTIMDAHEDEDVTQQEVRIHAITQEIRDIEARIRQILRASGAAESILAADVKVQNTQPMSFATDYEASKANIKPQPSGSSNISGTQVVLQTQISTKRLARSLDPNDDQNMESPNVSPGKAGRGRLSIPYNYGKQSISPIRKPLVAIDSNMHSVIGRVRSEPEGSDFGDEFPDGFDDDGLSCNVLAHLPDAVDNVEDDYGTIDDDDEMIELAENFDRRHSYGDFAMTPPCHDIPNCISPITNAQKLINSQNMSLPAHPGEKDMMRHAWSEDVKKVLKEIFRLRGFRSNQLGAINATLGGNDAFVLMPTGGGKSLCYQLPAMIQSGRTRGVTIVISPLISLMQDQVAHLNKLGIKAYFINGEVERDLRSQVMAFLNCRDPEKSVQLLYVTPEMVGKSSSLMRSLSDMYQRQKLARFVIDEAHCVSQWGHAFRPDYKALSELRKHYPSVPIIALTATATENVKVDVIHNLRIEGCQIFTQSFNRPNLTYEVRPKKKKTEVLASIVETISQSHEGESGIVYTLSRQNCEEMAAYLRKHNINAFHYHAGLESKVKAEVQKGWQAGELDVIVATIAFGMGIDKADVRFVIHHTVPKSLEGYYQETGRAGRDGKRSACYLYYGYQDTRGLYSFIDKEECSNEEKDRQRKMLSRMTQYCDNKSDCRRVQLLSYFGEHFQKDDCNHTCDNCNSDSVFETRDVSDLAQAAIHIVKKLHRDNLTVLNYVDLLRGTGIRKVTGVDPADIDGFGSASYMPRGEVERLVYRLLSEGALEEKNVIKGGFAKQYLMVGPTSREFSTGRRKLKLQIRVSPSAPHVEGSRTERNGNHGTGVAAAFNTDQNHQFTDVSSPILATRTRKGKNRYINDEAEAEADYEANHDEQRYNHGSFTGSDSSEDGFAPIRERGTRKTSNKHKPQLGPPITADQRILEAKVNSIHQMAIDQFMIEAKRLEETIRNEKNLKRPFFKEIHLREMAINWTTTIADMIQIHEIDKERVRAYGARFLPLVQHFHKEYEEMMGHRDQRVIDKSHQNVIDLVSDEGEDDGEDDGNLQETQTSKYFHTKSSLEPLKERFGTASRNSPSTQPHAIPLNSKFRPEPSNKPSRIHMFADRYVGSKPAHEAESRRGAYSNNKRGSRKTSGSAAKSGSGTTGGVFKRKKSSKRHSNGTRTSTGTSNVFKKFAKNGGESSAGAFGGIGMMPT